VASSVAALIAATLQLACGGTDCPTCPTERACPTPLPPTPTPEPTPDYTGFWRGTGLSLGLLTFTVADNENARNVNMEIGTVTTPNWWECRRFGFSWVAAGPFPVAKKKFTVDTAEAEAWSGLRATIAVTITSESTGTATLTLEHIDPADPCNGRQSTDTIALTKGRL